jgi:hypothetical protein
MVSPSGIVRTQGWRHRFIGGQFGSEEFWRRRRSLLVGEMLLYRVLARYKERLRVKVSIAWTRDTGSF